ARPATAARWPAGRRAPGSAVPPRTSVPAVLSLLSGADAVPAHRTEPFGPCEPVVLLCLPFVAVHRARPRWALVCGTLDGTGRGRVYFQSYA
ncbi:hypothetical protein P9869_25750, partial [Streptomyces ossamyceticus]|nr:hypothetical protein [Streptomyces ossamyceticus]